MNDKEIIKILRTNGWEVIRINGSHHRLAKGKERTTVPVHSKKDVGTGVIRAIEKQTGVKLK